MFQTTNQIIYSILEAPFGSIWKPTLHGLRGAELLPLVAFQWAGVGGCIDHPHWLAPKHSDAPDTDGSFMIYMEHVLSILAWQ